MYVPTFEDVVVARDFIAKHLPRTPLVHLAGISDALGCEYYAKLENLQPVGAFKVRGGVNLVGTSEPADLEKGLVTASTGNHGQSIAFAGKLFGTKVVIYAPAENLNPIKLQAMRDLGAEVRLHGRDFDQARLETERASQVEGFRYVHSANEPKLISGVGTIGLEIFEDLSDVDVIIAPAGGGSCAAGTCLVAKKLNPQVQVIAVQSEAAPAMWHAWRNHSLEEFPTMNTRHEGLATRVPFELTNRILWKHLDDFVLVNDDEIDHAVGLLSTKAKQVAEGAGAASLAAAIKIQDRLRGKRVVGIVTGGNIPATTFAEILKNMDQVPSKTT
jgi:threonine dehydratase